MVQIVFSPLSQHRLERGWGPVWGGKAGLCLFMTHLFRVHLPCDKRTTCGFSCGTCNACFGGSCQAFLVLTSLEWEQEITWECDPTALVALTVIAEVPSSSGELSYVDHQQEDSSPPPSSRSLWLMETHTSSQTKFWAHRWSSPAPPSMLPAVSVILFAQRGLSQMRASIS